MYAHAKEYGILYHNHPPYEVLSTNWLNFEDVLNLKKVEEMVEVYYNSHQFDMGIRVLEAGFENPFAMYQKLGDFYEEKGYDTLSHSRIRRCEILLEFAAKLQDTREDFTDILQEALIFDLYSRENCKSRPTWAVDMGGFKYMTHYYCKNGKLSHVEPFHYDFKEFLEMGGAQGGEKAMLPERHQELVWVLFSYEHRNPLTHSANMQVVEYVWQDRDLQPKG
jgi:hypothetical protein